MKRAQLLAELDRASDLPLTLVAAPAGYGKSTLVSDWLAHRDGLSAWLSLDEADNNIETFISYLVAALRSVIPSACGETLNLLQADELPSSELLAGSLGNDLAGINEPVVLVFDDYHCISDKGIHEMLDHLLSHPPQLLRLVLISRRDPPLSLAVWRANGLMSAIRSRDLRFTKAETAAVLKLVSGLTVDDAALALLHDITEGWPVGMRLAALTLKRDSDVDAFARRFRGDMRHVQDYLIAEVLSHQPAAFRIWLYKLSILKRFCPSLCNAILAEPGSEGGISLNGKDFVGLLSASGLPHSELGEREEWYRYHHLVQELLQQQLEVACGPDEVAELHRRAAIWLEEHGFLEEALRHAANSGDSAAANQLILRHMTPILNEARWFRLERWLARFSSDTIQTDLGLLVLQGWARAKRGQDAGMQETVERIEEISGGDLHNAGLSDRLKGSINALCSHLKFCEGRFDLAEQCAERALNELPANCLIERAYALEHLAGAYLWRGDEKQARRLIYDALAGSAQPNSEFDGRLLVALGLLGWITTDLATQRQAAARCIELAGEIESPDGVMYGHYLSGIAYYDANDLPASETFLNKVLVNKWTPNLQYFAQSAFALASVYQAMGLSEQANGIANLVCQRLLKQRHTVGLSEALAFQAELALRQGHLAEAVGWAQQSDLKPLQTVYKFYVAEFTLAKVLIAENSVESRKRAGDLIRQLVMVQTHSTRFQINVLGLKALLFKAQGDPPAAQEALQKAVLLAQPGGCIRLFVDLGAELKPLLHRLDLDVEGSVYVARILAAFPDTQTENDAATSRTVIIDSYANCQPLPEPLTKRELQILAMLSERLTSKEISEKLFISTATVKRHRENIYQKLGVHGHREAVSRAKELSLVPDSRPFPI